MIVMIDNYDSFTYNLVQYLRQIGPEVRVVRNDRTSVAEVRVLEPGADRHLPRAGAAGNRRDIPGLIRAFSGDIPILGVCLGHQAIGVAFGGAVVPARRLMHGKMSTVTADGRTIFTGHPLPVPGHALPLAGRVQGPSAGLPGDHRRIRRR